MRHAREQFLRYGHIAFAWWKTDPNIMKRRTVAVWLRVNQRHLQHACNFLVDVSNKAFFELHYSQSAYDQAVQTILHYDAVECPQARFGLTLALRLGVHAPLFRECLLRAAMAVLAGGGGWCILHTFGGLPWLHGFPLGLLSVFIFLLMAGFSGYRQFPIIRAVMMDQELCKQLFHMHLASLYRQAHGILNQQEMKQISGIQKALHAIHCSKRLDGHRWEEEALEGTAKAVELSPPSMDDYPFKDAWERFLREVFRLKAGNWQPPAYRETETTIIFIWDIPSIAFSRWEENVSRIEAYIKKPFFCLLRDYNGLGTVAVEIAKHPLPDSIPFPTVISLESVEQTSSEVIVGINCKGAVRWNYVRIPHGLIAGTTGSGKTNALYVLLLQLQRQGHELALIDLKGGVSLGMAEEAGYPVAVTKEAALLMLQGAVRELERRERLMKGIAADIDSYNRLNNEKLYRRFIVFDEVAQFTDKWSGYEEGISCLKTIASKGRSNGIHLLIATQRPSQESLGSTDFRSNILYRCVGRMDAPASSAIALGNNAAYERLPSTDYAGLFIVRGANAPADSMMKVPYMEDAEFRRLFQQYRNPHRPAPSVTPAETPRNYNDIF